MAGAVRYKAKTQAVGWCCDLRLQEPDRENSTNKTILHSTLRHGSIVGPGQLSADGLQHRAPELH